MSSRDSRLFLRATVFFLLSGVLPRTGRSSFVLQMAPAGQLAVVNPQVGQSSILPLNVRGPFNTRPSEFRVVGSNARA